jgi:Zn-dependent protease with chaperone function
MLPGNVSFIIQNFLKKTKIYSNPELTKKLSSVWNYPVEKIHLHLIFGRLSDNIAIKYAFDSLEIYIGDKFLKSVDIDELIFSLSHEFGHDHSKFSIFKKGFVFAFFIISYSFFCIMLFFLVSSFEIDNFLIISTILLFVLGIMIMNYLSWRDEYNADTIGLLKSRNLESAIKLLTSFSGTQKDYGIIVNLIFYTHPNPQYRILNLKRLDLQKK